MYGDQISDQDRIACLVDANSGCLRIDDQRGRFGDSPNRSRASAGAAEARHPLSGMETMIAAAIEHHEIALRRHLATFIAQHEMPRVREIWHAVGRRLWHDGLDE